MLRLEAALQTGPKLEFSAVFTNSDSPIYYKDVVQNKMKLSFVFTHSTLPSPPLYIYPLSLSSK